MLICRVEGPFGELYMHYSEVGSYKVPRGLSFQLDGRVMGAVSRDLDNCCRLARWVETRNYLWFL